MDKLAFAKFSVCLQYRSPGSAPAWDNGCSQYYFAALSEIPDADGPMLMKAIMTGGCGKFRPDPDEVLALWRKITRPAPALAEEVAGRMLLKRREKGIFQRRIPNDPYCRWETCEPVFEDPVEARISAAMGGWTAFCQDDSPLGVLRGQLLKTTAAILSNEADTVVNALRLEYEASRPGPAKALEKPVALIEGLMLEGLMLTEPAEEGAGAAINRHEAAEIMGRFTTRLGRAVCGRLPDGTD